MSMARNDAAFSPIEIALIEALTRAVLAELKSECEIGRVGPGQPLAHFEEPESSRRGGTCSRHDADIAADAPNARASQR
jgi:hypothetical protein